VLRDEKLFGIGKIGNCEVLKLEAVGEALDEFASAPTIPPIAECCISEAARNHPSR
jgi:hypothetical protein